MPDWDDFCPEGQVAGYRLELVRVGFLPSYECGDQVQGLGEFLLWEACLHCYCIEFDAAEVGCCPCDALGFFYSDA